MILNCQIIGAESMQEGLTESDAVNEGLLINIHNGAMKQYYYNVVLQLNNIGLNDISTTEDFYDNVLWCCEAMLHTDECIDELIEMQGENNEVFK